MGVYIVVLENLIFGKFGKIWVELLAHIFFLINRIIFYQILVQTKLIV